MIIDCKDEAEKMQLLPKTFESYQIACVGPMTILCWLGVDDCSGLVTLQLTYLNTTCNQTIQKKKICTIYF